MACRLSRQKKSVKYSNLQGSALSTTCIHVNNVVQHRLLSAACQNGAEQCKVVILGYTAHTCTTELFIRRLSHTGFCANGLSLAAHPCEEDAAGQSSHSADAEVGGMQEQQHTAVQHCWPSAAPVACHAVQEGNALMSQRGSGLQPTPGHSKLQLNAQQTPSCRCGSINLVSQICKQRD